jgi:hypothetical protein
MFPEGPTKTRQPVFMMHNIFELPSDHFGLVSPETKANSL